MQRLVLACCVATASCVIDRHPALPDAVELCNGVDDDGDPQTADGADEPALGDPCDGPDDDLCPAGRIACVGGQLVCEGDDRKTDDVEVCNELDDDCDGMVDEGIDVDGDANNCGFCGHACANANGTTACVAGACVPTCAAGASDCNANPDDGCEVFRNRNPTCTMAVAMGAIPGDLGTESLELVGTDEAFFDVLVREESSAAQAITATITLDSPQGANFDLFVTCGSCGGALMGSSKQPAGIQDTVQFRHDDVDLVNDDRILHVEVRFASASATTCGGEWHLKVAGDTIVPAETCP